ncbi:hypothetical protein [Nocardiopsis ganjiahuensis]|uniref:hypothetical protein n=1 Tax=Nocardiopsis ganjiahuensis TaxID=239984 RepID=UPI000349395E|nr:hypothetical protein [Nocardiopsis ganjiahuensis]
MDGVLSRTPTGRPRVAAVGALLALCLVGAPLMSLLLAALWKTTRGLALGGLGQGALLIAPVAVGALALMIFLATAWLRRSGVTRPTSCACLVTGTATATPLVLGFLAPAFTPVPGGILVNSAVVSALVSTSALGLCVLLSRESGRRQPGILPGVAVVAAALLILPFASELMRDKSTEQRSLAQIDEFDHTIAVLDHPSWTPVRVHEVHGGLRVTYTAGGAPEGEERTDASALGAGRVAEAGAAGPGAGADSPEDVRAGALHVLSWTPERMEEGVHSGCEFPGVECSESDSLLVVHRGVGSRDGARLSEVRTRLEDGSVASAHPVGALSPELVFAVAQTLRAEKPGEREALSQAIVRS